MTGFTSEETSPSENDGSEQETRASRSRADGAPAPAVDTPDLSEAARDGSGDDAAPGAESGSGDAAASRDPTGPQDSGSEGRAPEEGEIPQDDDPSVQLEKARAEAAENYDRYLRAAAELDNFRKRAVRMRAESREETLRDLLLQIAPLMDNMRRALAQEAAEARSLKQGIELILSQFQTILNGYGLEEIEAVGNPFDPNLHEAMLEVESADCEPGTILEEMEKGYRLREKVLRPARVVVGKAPAEREESEASDGK